MNDDIRCMLKIAHKYKVNLVAIRMTPHLLAQLPAWYHLLAEWKPIAGATVKCLLEKHNVSKVADLIKTSGHLRHPTQYQLTERTKTVPAKNVMVRSPCLSVVLVLEFSDRGISQIGSRPDVSIRKLS